jgi:hypothetical protein
MRPETLLGYLRAQPFRPFRITMNSGRTFDVRHPEMIRVGRDSLLYFHAEAEGAPFESWDTVSLLLIEKVEFLHQPTPTK